MKTYRISTGNYQVTDGTRSVNVSRLDFGYGDEWIAAACWDQHLHTDPLPTKREAVFQAQEMLADAS